MPGTNSGEHISFNKIKASDAFNVFTIVFCYCKVQVKTTVITFLNPAV